MTIQKGMKFLCRTTIGPFYTEGKIYEVLTDPVGGVFTMTDDFGTATNDGRGHDWCVHDRFKVMFRRPDADDAKRIDLAIATDHDDELQLLLTVEGKTETFTISRSTAASMVDRIVRVLAKSA